MANRFSSIQCVQPTSVHRISSRLRLWEGKSAIRVVIAGLDLGKDGNRNPAAADDGSPLTVGSEGIDDFSDKRKNYLREVYLSESTGVYLPFPVGKSSAVLSLHSRCIFYSPTAQ